MFIIPIQTTIVMYLRKLDRIRSNRKMTSAIPSRISTITNTKRNESVKKRSVVEIKTNTSIFRRFAPEKNGLLIGRLSCCFLLRAIFFQELVCKFCRFNFVKVEVFILKSAIKSPPMPPKSQLKFGWN